MEWSLFRFVVMVKQRWQPRFIQSHLQLKASARWTWDVPKTVSYLWPISSFQIKHQAERLRSQNMHIFREIARRSLTVNQMIVSSRMYLWHISNLQTILASERLRGVHWLVNQTITCSRTHGADENSVDNMHSVFWNTMAQVAHKSDSADVLSSCSYGLLSLQRLQIRFRATLSSAH